MLNLDEALAWCQEHRAHVLCCPTGFRVEVYISNQHYAGFDGETILDAVRRAERLIK